jgi:hypothetical protein
MAVSGYRVQAKAAVTQYCPPSMKPTPEQVERATDALVPFVQEWNLSLNPEDLAEIAYAVLLHHDSAASWDEIEAAVRAQIEDHRRQAQSLSDAMRHDLDERE